MEQGQALEVLLQVAQLAQSKGILSLKDAVIVAQAVELFTKKEEEAVEELVEKPTLKKVK